MRLGAGNSGLIAVGGMLAALCVLGWMLVGLDSESSQEVGAKGDKLLVYCAAGTRPAMQAIVDQYKQKFGVSVQIQYSGSNTLLSQIEVANTGDVYIAADDTYIELGQQRGLIQESLPFARQRPVIAVLKGNPSNITSIDDLLRPGVRYGLGNFDQAAVGKVTKRLLEASGHWERIKAKTLVFKPTVPEVANDIKLRTVDAGIIWDATLNNYPELEAIRCPELDAGVANISVGILTATKHSRRALHFARYLAAPEKGQKILKSKGFETCPGDPWAETPEITFFAGAVNRAAVEPAVEAFRKREGVVVNTTYNGCGFLTGTMKQIDNQSTAGGFPDAFMACDVYYLDQVRDWFQDSVRVSDTSVVIAVRKGNPKNIQSLEDLAKPGVRISVGQPKQCTVGVLTSRLFDESDLTEKIRANVVAEKPSSAMLVPDVVTGSVDATLAYATDAKREAARIDTIRIDSETAVAIQPFSVAKSTPYKQLSRRLFETVAASKSSFEEAGFHWRLDAASDKSGTKP